MQNKVNELKKLTILKDYQTIKDILINEDSTKKGPLFEEYIKMLYEGQGYIATIVGGKNDGGADILLAKPHNPNKIIWVIQCKNRKDLLNEDTIAYEILKYENKAKKKYPSSSYKLISLSGYTDCMDIFRDLDVSLEDFEYVKLLIDNYNPDKSIETIILPDLKPHNRWSYKEAYMLLNKYLRVSIPNATGTGKSYIIAQFLYDYLGKKVLVLSSSKDCLKAIKKVSFWAKPYTCYMTYSKLSKRKTFDNDFDLIVLDEMHRVGAKEWGRGVTTLLNMNKNAKVVALSATPIRHLDNQRNMIEELTDGIHTKPLMLFDCIARGILPNPKYVTAVYNTEEASNTSDILSNNKDTKNSIRKFSNPNTIVDIIKKYAPENSNGLKFIVFCENRHHLNKVYFDVMQWLSEAYDYKYRVKPSVVISSQKDNQKELENFENDSSKDIKVLFCIDKLNEGLHVKNGGINGIFLLRKTSSPNIYLQQIGRIFDCSKSVEEPVIFDFVNNIENINSSYFSNSLQESKNKVNSNRAKLGLKPLNIEIKSFKEIPKSYESIKKIEKKSLLGWNDYLKLAIEYNKKFKMPIILNRKRFNKEENVEPTFDKLKEYNISFKELYDWCRVQRNKHIKGELNQKEVEKLIELDFFNKIVSLDEPRAIDGFKYNLNICKEEILKHINKSNSNNIDIDLNKENYHDYILLKNRFVPKIYFNDLLERSGYYYHGDFNKKVKEIKNDSFVYNNKKIKLEDNIIFHSKYTPSMWFNLQTTSYLYGQLDNEKKYYFELFLDEINLYNKYEEIKSLYLKNINKLKEYIHDAILFYIEKKIDYLIYSERNPAYIFKIFKNVTVYQESILKPLKNSMNRENTIDYFEINHIIKEVNSFYLDFIYHHEEMNNYIEICECSFDTKIVDDFKKNPFAINSISNLEYNLLEEHKDYFKDIFNRYLTKQLIK